ncbi:MULTISPECIES: (2Fe-2S)-binding protein [unclassified Moritella]|uniref:(2Fe-2S)-binding protein n=1 Tax=unclassified Moritella TaxID=2637987 RepID=UPI00015698F2|nr:MULTISPECIES: (2Fe-2S)-binding protein [unclassified Moritella]EDM64859.1 bacterioferritin-associated ferredoxin [Moritella sp. PE36]MBL1416654.1 (2Fe-2S)-binding protein [Moritella sp.]MCJ8352056.1 (2Fe-2S)-binding protein [Moritella sp.]NQZ42137.1 (2Fe-2S)-binding protein [Moritella sp.]
MYVCICRGITDKQMIKSIDDGANTMKKLSGELGIGSQCGKCCQCAKKILNQTLIKQAQQQPLVA